MVKCKGFTLMQLMITVLIFSILTLIAYPAYQSYVQKTRLQAARAAMLENAHFMEKFYRQKGRFKKTSTEWPDLPIKGVDGFCIRLNGKARGALDSRFMLKAVALDKNKEPRVIKMNESMTTFICESSLSTCDDDKNYFEGRDQSCKLFQ